MQSTLFGRLHAELFHLYATLRADERGQGTVEYIALLLLMAGVFGFVATKAGTDIGIGKKITDQVDNAITSVVDKGGKKG